ncbi:MAG: acyl-CoA/acyl-ACP dehydrogenase [Actinomycetota bacterium]|nr:acyl-CoA/acyl-ACP dehydrogenase [Actinomycetota bacterium]
MTPLEARQRAERLADRFRARAAEYDRTASFPAADVEDIRTESLLGLMVPTRLGGVGCGFEDYVEVGTALARGSGATALVFNMHAAVTGALAGVPEDLVRALGAGDEFFAVRDRILDGAVEGALYGVAISEWEAGSRLSEVRTYYEPEGEAYRLRGEKSVCSGAGYLDGYLVAARARETGGPEPSVSYFMVSPGLGVKVKDTWDPLGMRATASNAVVLDVAVPRECLLTGVEGLAVPLAYAMPQWLVTSYAAVYVGIAQAALSEAVTYLKQRQAGGRTTPASVRARVARAQAATDAALLVVRQAARLADASPGDSETNRWLYQAKLVAGDAAMEVAATLSEACGLGALGRGSALERIFRDARCGAIMPPRSDICADYLGSAALGLDPMTAMDEPPW